MSDTIRTDLSALKDRVAALEQKARAMTKFGPYWTLFLKIHLAVVSLVGTPALVLGGWVVSEAFESRSFRQSGERFTQNDGRLMRDNLRTERDALKTAIEIRMEANAKTLAAMQRDIDRLLFLAEKNENTGLK